MVIILGLAVLGLAVLRPPATTSWRDAIKLVSEQRKDPSVSADDVIPAYRYAIRSCGREGQWRAAVDLLQQLRDDHGTIDNGCYSEAMCACRKGGAWKVALTLYEDLPAPDVYTTSNAIAACEPTGQWKRALAILDAQPAANAICVNAAISACSSAGQWQEAVKLLERLEAQSPPPSANVAAGSSRRGRRQDRRPRGRGEDPNGPSARSYASAMTACTRNGQWQSALELWERLEARGLADGAAYGAAVAACAKGAQAAKAMRLIGAMRRAGVPGYGDVRVYNAALMACANAKSWPPARQLLTDMRRWGVVPTVRTYNGALAAAASARRWQAAVRVLESMELEGISPDAVSFGTAIAACERARQWRVAVELYSAARAYGVADVGAANSVISALARGPGWAAALGVLRQMDGRDQGEGGAGAPLYDPPNAKYVTLGRVSYGDAASPPQQQALLRPDARSYGPVLMAMARAHQWRRALELIDGEMTGKGMRVGAYAGCAVITALGRHRQWERALELLHAIDRPNVACFTAAAGACGRCGEGEAALALLDEMDFLGIVPDPRALQTVAWAAGRGSGWTASLATLRRLRADGYAVEPADFLGVALAVCEDEDATFAMLRAAADEGIAVDALTFYSAVLQGWQGAATVTPSDTAASMLRGLAAGELPLTSDLRAWNLLCEVALEAADFAVEEGFGDDDDEEEDEEEEEAAGNTAMDESEVGARVSEIEELIDDAYRQGVAEGVLDCWVGGGESDATKAIDLHGHSVPMARAAVRHTLEALRAKHALNRGSNAKPLLVITGQGRRSSSEAVLGPAVLQLVREELSPPVTAQSVPGNDGRLVLDGESVQQWMEANSQAERDGSED